MIMMLSDISDGVKVDTGTVQTDTICLIMIFITFYQKA